MAGRPLTAKRVSLDATTVSILHGNFEGTMYIDNFLVPYKSISEDHVSVCTSSFIEKYVNRRANKSEEPSLSTDGNAQVCKHLTMPKVAVTAISSGSS
jgi:hypothetical protein